MRFFSIALVLALLAPFSLWAQSSRNVTVSSRTYHDLDVLISQKLVRKFIMGQRPFSRLQVARMILEAESNLDNVCNEKQKEDDALDMYAPPRCNLRGSFSEDLLINLRREFAEELRYLEKGSYQKPVKVEFLDSLQVSSYWLDSPRRTIPVSNGVGTIDAFVNPLVDNREGRHLPSGGGFSFETEHWLRLSPYFTFDFKPRFESFFPDKGPNDETKPRVDNLYVKAAYSNVELEIGRDSLLWGQGDHGGLLLSDNARPLDLIKISNDAPYRFPWIFKHLGNFKGSLFAANLGPEYSFSRAYLTGLKFSFQPARFFEFGMSQGLIMGGKGAPGLSIGSVLAEFFASRGGFLSTSGVQAQNLSNRMTGGDFRFTIPPLRNSVFYFEMQTDDAFFSRFKTNWGYLAGLYMPRLDSAGTVGLRIEARHIPAVYYRHSTFLSGFTLNRQLLGDAEGPDSMGIRASFEVYLNELNLLKLEGRWTFYDSDIWNSRGGSFEFVSVTDNQSEKRFLVLLSDEHTFKEGITLKGRAGYEHVENFNFRSGNDQDNFLIDLAIELNIPQVLNQSQ